MSRLILLIFLLINCFSASAQEDNFAYSFLEKLIREKQPEGKIIYTDRINKTEFNKIKSWLSKNYIVGISDDTKGNFIELTRQEKKYILQQLEVSSYTNWPDNIFSNSGVVKQEEKLSSVKKIYEEFSENLDNPNNNEETKNEILKNYQRPNVFSFSNLVYIRDQTIFIVFISSICGDPCGREELYFYKKSNSGWVKFIMVNSHDY